MGSAGRIGTTTEERLTDTEADGREGTGAGVLRAALNGGRVLADAEAVGFIRLDSGRLLAVGIEVGRGRPEAFLMSFRGEGLASRPFTASWALRGVVASGRRGVAAFSSLRGVALLSSLRGVGATMLSWIALRGVAVTALLLARADGAGKPNPAHFALKILSSSPRITFARSLILTSSSVGGGTFSREEVRI